MSTEYKTLGKGTYGSENGLRPGTKLHRWVLNMVFNSGGMGDFVNYAGATMWVAKNCPWVDGVIFTPRYLNELMRIIHKDFPNWQVHPSEDIKSHIAHRTALVGPDIILNGLKVSRQLLACVGAHPFDVGFAYYAGTQPTPFDARLPILDFPRVELPSELKDAPYVVVPTGNQSPARRVTGRHLNPIIDWLKDQNITPVFLGKADLLGDGVTTSTFADDINYAKGIDLRDKTTVVEAARILQHAQCTVGLDNGLLHLAALMKDSKIIFGYNITTVEHRVPRRDHGKTINLSLSSGDLACNACQSNLKQVAVHKFDQCLYGDNKCVDLLFAGDSVRWRNALHEMIFGG